MVGEECYVPGCRAPACGRGLCAKHGARQRRGSPLVDVRPAVGSADGFGLYGILDDDGQTVMCHECGRRFRSVAVHANRTHHMTAAEYRTAHGLSRGKALISRESSELMSAVTVKRFGTPMWDHLVASRDPSAARAARTKKAYRPAPADLPMRIAIAAALGNRRRVRVYTCKNCGAQWCPLPGTTWRRTCSDKCARALVSKANSGPRKLRGTATR